MRVLHDAPHRLVARAALSSIYYLVDDHTVPSTVLQPALSQAFRKDAPAALSLSEPSHCASASIRAQKRMDGLPRAHALCRAVVTGSATSRRRRVAR